MSHPIAVIDFETTGISPGQGARATEVAIVLLEGCLLYTSPSPRD